MTVWVDYSGGELDPNLLLRNNIGGGLRYGGTPGRTKNMQPGDVANALAAGLQQAVVYEDTARDAEAGYAAGVAHAQALLADCARCKVPNTVPLAAAADEHLTAAQVSVAVQYQAGFYRTVKASGWVGPVGAYGFAEFTTAARAAGVADWFWQCGAWSAVDRSWVHLYQRNGSDGPTTNHAASGQLAGIAVDFNDQLLPLPDSPKKDNAMAEPLYVQTEQLKPDGSKIGNILKGLYDGGFLTGLGAADIAIWDAKVAAGEIKECTWITWSLWTDWDSKGNQLLRLFPQLIAAIGQNNTLLQQLCAAAGNAPVATVDHDALKAEIDQDVAAAITANPLHLSGDVTIHPPTA